MSNAAADVGPLHPGGVIGILGGGQLGRMLALAAARLGFRAFVYSDDPEAPAFHVAWRSASAAYDDEARLAEFADACDAVTFEFENVPATAARVLSEHVTVRPNARALAVAQDRIAEKNFVAGLGIATAPFREVRSAQDARAAFAALGGPCILKTSRLGYDGKGQAKIARAEDADAAFVRLGGVPAILERFVDFAFEASVIAARGAGGNFAAYDPPMNEHENHILRRSTVPAPLDAAQAAAAKRIAETIVQALDYVGVIGVELFVARDGTLLVNEIAPRVHNSGHWTLEACAVSQFEQHIRAVAGWPLGNPERHSDAVMENILGGEAARWRDHLGKGALHLYGKREARPGRKMGHVTRIAPKGTLAPR